MRKLKESRSLKLCIISFPSGVTQYRAKLVKLLEPICDELYMITGNVLHKGDFPENGNFHLITIRSKAASGASRLPKWLSLPARVFNLILWQVEMSYQLIRLSRDIDTVVFFIGGDLLILPLLSAKLLRKRVVKIVTESTAELHGMVSGKFAHYGLKYHVLKFLEKITNSLCDQIIMETESTIKWVGMENYKSKIVLGGQIYTDTNFFRITRPYSTRENVVGYIGESAIQKGVVNFAKAIPLIANYLSDVKFIVGEKGRLSPEVGEELRNSGMLSQVTRLRWIPQEGLPDWLNQLKLFVIPSYSETGVPAVVLEAMACGTPVLATAVGGITDAIQDERTGFILKENSPEEIANAAVRILAYSNIDELIRNARDMVEKEYSFEAVQERYRNIFCGNEAK